MLLKYCSRCETTKSRDAFGPNARSPDGLQGWCRDCRRGYIPPVNRELNNLRSAIWREMNPKRRAAHQRKSWQKHRDKRLAYLRGWRERNPDAHRDWRIKNLWRWKRIRRRAKRKWYFRQRPRRRFERYLVEKYEQGERVLEHLYRRRKNDET